MPRSDKHISCVFTWNNYPKDWAIQLRPYVTWYLGKPERGEKNGTPHIQGAAQFSEGKSLFQLGRLGKALGCAFKPARGDLQSQYDYIGKIETTDGDMVEWGTNPGDAWKPFKPTDWEEVWRFASEGDYMAIDPDIRFNKIDKIERIHNIALRKKARYEVEELGDGPWGLYVWGPSGLGKSTWVRKQNPSLFVKGDDVWWDGYEGEECVLFDDFDQEEYKSMGAKKLKTLVDRFPFPAKFRGFGQKLIRPRLMIFTSNYSPQYVFGAEWKNIERRFEVKEIKEKMF